MKSKLLSVVILSVLAFFAFTAQTTDKSKNPVGTWKFEAPYAPMGYQAGTINVAIEENKYKADMAFSGSDSKVPADNIKAANDSIQFTVFVEGQDVRVKLKLEDNSKMSGLAVYSEGEVPLTLSRDTDKK
jgi:hypothetical protein